MKPGSTEYKAGVPIRRPFFVDFVEFNRNPVWSYADRLNAEGQTNWELAHTSSQCALRTRLHCKFNKARHCSLEQEPTPVTDSTTKITDGAVGNYPALNRNSSLLRNRDINHRIIKILSQNLSPFRITTYVVSTTQKFFFEIYFNIFLSSKVNDSGEIINIGPYFIIILGLLTSTAYHLHIENKYLIGEAIFTGRSSFINTVNSPCMHVCEFQYR